MLYLGDNIFHGDKLPQFIRNAIKDNQGATIFGQYVNDPERYGVATCDSNGHVLTLEEKPNKPQSNIAVTGLYIFDNQVSHIAKSIQPSNRGELEITDVNREYLKQQKLTLKLLSRGTTWLDTGTHESLHNASVFIEVLEKRQSLKIACLEEIAYRMSFISKSQLLAESTKYNNDYGNYLKHIAEDIP